MTFRDSSQDRQMSVLRGDPAYVVTVLCQVVDRNTKVSVHDECAAVVFPRKREYLNGVRLTDFDDEDGIAYFVKQQMIAMAYARDSMSQSNPIRVLREKMMDRQTYMDAVVITTKEYNSIQDLYRIPPGRWIPDGKGLIFNGIVNNDFKKEKLCTTI